MPRWAIVVEQTTGFGDNKIWSPKVLAEVVGTREQAVAKLSELVGKFVPDHPKLVSRRTVLRDGDNYMLIARGWSDDFHCLFRVWEVLSDSEEQERLRERRANH
ncbi:hypothetical protein IU501_16080 [Nocardia otitidiscaviarum]|uniref:Uncharacterized protein n=1 Tax=Nocardia otitidiscaviarum TaxID=1823 RepID=A0A379JI59_9NOCA|nr:hypothetical protein [Nocardia otitidiscaviarum]MBF6134516.1 hypothetical protein [Nocardia otitidiscaviarum]MBF6239610.1 hypothetical protein [Nocardia otitidiscaviarum]MBF6485858.1 hypothetical protein [Nocardia otitidiscaviarum]SUD48165.1 Uncharacterised protein [Nocardia otitidiscaviarum]